MIILFKTRRWFAILISTVQLFGCATAGQNTLPKGGDLTMAAIFQQKTGLSMEQDTATSSHSTIRQLRDQLGQADKIDHVGYTRTSQNEITALFKRLPNPEVQVYIYPHLVQTDEDIIAVPGYSTAFYLYQANHFALPSENF